MDVNEQTLDVMTNDGEMAVVVTSPSGDGSWPVVLLFIDAPGLRPATREFMARMASEGYTVVTPDLHHRLGRLLSMEPADMAANPDARSIMTSWIQAMTDEQIQHDGQRALEAAGVGSDEPYAVIGFCLGARAVYRAMEQYPDRVRCGAGWHPSFLVDDGATSPHRTVAALDRPLYLGIGEADQVQSIAMHQKFLDAASDNDNVDIVTFAGADHGYTWPGYPNYHAEAAETSWTKTLAMFAAAFSD